MDSSNHASSLPLVPDTTAAVVAASGTDAQALAATIAQLDWNSPTWGHAPAPAHLSPATIVLDPSSEAALAAAAASVHASFGFETTGGAGAAAAAPDTVGAKGPAAASSSSSSEQHPGDWQVAEPTQIDPATGWAIARKRVGGKEPRPRSSEESGEAEAAQGAPYAKARKFVGGKEPRRADNSAEEESAAASAAPAADVEMTHSASAAAATSSSSGAAASSSPAASASAAAAPSHHLTDEERAIYDRQLRVWGVEAQKRMRESSILIIGVHGLSCEVAKNLVLAGVGSVTLMDGGSVRAEDLAANFLLRESDIGRNRAQASLPQLQVLNPNVRVSARDVDVALALQQDPHELKQYSAVLLVNQSIATQVRVNELLRQDGAAAVAAVAADPSSAASIPPPTAFFSGECLGLSAYFFEDLQVRPYTETKKAKDATGRETDEEVISAGTASYHRTAKQLFGGGSSDAEAATFAQLVKKFGKKTQEKAACKLWMAIRVGLEWREQQQTKGIAAALPSLDDPTALASLLALRASFASRLGVSAGEVDTFLPSAFLTSVCRLLNCELSHVCAIVGGILGQEMLKVISGKDQPLANTFIYSATEGYGLMKEL